MECNGGDRPCDIVEEPARASEEASSQESCKGNDGVEGTSYEEH